MQKENLFFFSFPSESTLDKVKGRISERNAKGKPVFLFLYFFHHKDTMLPLRISNLLATFFKIFLEKESRRMEKGKIFFLLA